MNINEIKSQFPIFSKKINGKPLIYLDSSNSSQKPLSVINKLSDFYKYEFSNMGLNFKIFDFINIAQLKNNSYREKT